MPSSQVELTIEIYTEEGWTPVIAWDNFARAILKKFIDSGIFADEVNPGLEIKLIPALFEHLLLKMQQHLK